MKDLPWICLCELDEVAKHPKLGFTEITVARFDSERERVELFGGELPSLAFSMTLDVLMPQDTLLDKNLYQILRCLVMKIKTGGRHPVRELR
jgi:hypothetical protein